ncbi:hypothetical protein HBI56_184890 [Parastagonospora nodorum]|uniref:Uncharacterized protein n=1 Tax=Phaeosphaeria nodorum (strain SN15 / ATCC MYA-4574 / FGSC 10173) TaxID=321614 RepID=A0A7U2FCU6_PHANO|nr:hypothetical protein HBH54_008610 [Parastagonospora nodorum]QRD02942.1 hypothetical protein JI435_441460 [Parastagonospora nodorum SN15]KAH3938779.1 hypothetical protein HBH53_245770 [Parastagonospora nodorum]KAH3966516.1 hypothetical protein HBH52_197570 [Parastagonospora nodorum]KAH3977793.1 hypothetical protein HBH51_070400 [Parastagonospora nodorum]
MNALAIKCYFFLIGPWCELVLSKFSEGGPITTKKQLRIMGGITGWSIRRSRALQTKRQSSLFGLQSYLRIESRLPQGEYILKCYARCTVSSADVCGCLKKN